MNNDIMIYLWYNAFIRGVIVMELEFPKNLPFKNERQVKESIRNGETKIIYPNLGLAMDLARLEKKGVSLGLYLGFWLSIFITLLFAILNNNYWLFALLPVYLIFNTFIRTIIRYARYSFIILILGFIFFDKHYIISCILFCIATIIIVSKLRIESLYKTCDKFILDDKEAFLALWYERNICLMTSDGKMYMHSEFDNKE